MAKAFVMPGLTLVEDYKPTPLTRNRAREENPFNAMIDGLAETWDDELKRSKCGQRVGPFPPDERGRITNLISGAAKAAGFSPRFDDKANENGFGVLVVYLIPKITRKRKNLRVTTVSLEKSTTADTEADAVTDETVELEQTEESVEADDAESVEA